MTGRSTEFGRMMDGVGGYVTHTAIYLGILASAWRGGAGDRHVALALGAAVANVVHAQMYDYHRTAYIAIAVERRAHRGDGRQSAQRDRRPLRGDAAAAVAACIPRSNGLRRRAARTAACATPIAQRYRRCFYWPVRGWNLLGDNTRFYAIGVLAGSDASTGSFRSCSCR